MPRRRPAYPRPRGRLSLVDVILLVGALDRPISWANTPKKWNLKLSLDEPQVTIRRRAFYRAIEKLTNLRLMHEAKPGFYPASWIVGGSRAEQKAARDYIAKRQLEIIPPVGIGKDETRAQRRRNGRIKTKAFKILRDQEKLHTHRTGETPPYKPKIYYLDDLKKIVEQKKRENRLLGVIIAEKKRLFRSPKLTLADRERNRRYQGWPDNYSS